MREIREEAGIVAALAAPIGITRSYMRGRLGNAPLRRVASSNLVGASPTLRNSEGVPGCRNRLSRVVGLRRRPSLGSPSRRVTPTQAPDIAPINSGADPYRVIRDWGQLTLEKRPWGGSNGVAIDRDGRSVWATDRCSPGIMPGCLGTKANPIHHFDEAGKEIRSFGGGMLVWPHGIHVDRDGNVWVTDARAASPDELTKYPGEDRKGSVVYKFSPEGELLMTLGKPGVRGNPPDALTDPNDAITDPANGDIYVAESQRLPASMIPISSGASRCSTAMAGSCASSARPAAARANSARRT